MKIEYLKDNSKWIPTIARWFHDEWGVFHPDLDLGGIEKRLAERCNTDRIPLTLVALEKNEVVGTVSLKKHDMDTRMQYTPWLASLYVIRTFRNKGVGVELIESALEKAVYLGEKQLYLYTRIKGHMYFYLVRGWTFMEAVEYRGGPVVILRKALQ